MLISTDLHVFAAQPVLYTPHLHLTPRAPNHNVYQLMTRLRSLAAESWQVENIGFQVAECRQLLHPLGLQAEVSIACLQKLSFVGFQVQYGKLLQSAIARYTSALEGSCCSTSTQHLNVAHDVDKTCLYANQVTVAAEPLLHGLPQATFGNDNMNRLRIGTDCSTKL